MVGYCIGEVFTSLSKSAFEYHWANVKWDTFYSIIKENTEFFTTFHSQGNLSRCISPILMKLWYVIEHRKIRDAYFLLSANIHFKRVKTIPKVHHQNHISLNVSGSIEHFWMNQNGKNLSWKEQQNHMGLVS